MPSVRAAAALAALLAASHVAAAEAVAAEAVYEIRLAVDVPITIAGFAIASTPYLLHDVLPHRCPCDPSDLNRLDRTWWDRHSAGADRASDVTVVVALTAPPIADALRLGFGPTFGADALVYAETLAVNSALVVGAKYAFHRPLPRTYQGDPNLLDSDHGYRSFYSGHTSTVVAALTAAAWTARWRYDEQGWPWVLVGVGGASVAVERVLAGRHFPTDVIAGAVMGFTVGTAVPWLHRKPGEPAVTVTPLPAGLQLSGRF
ncbi:MAG TPA: phosphatase PAP2 family protein [Anaeromyxobacter sp.]